MLHTTKTFKMTDCKDFEKLNRTDFYKMTNITKHNLCQNFQN